LFDVNEVKDVSKRINRARWVEMLVDVGNHLKPFTIESTFLNKEIGDRGLAIEDNDLLPPHTCGSVLSRSNQLL
jgi:hypothetical protein